MRLAPGNLQLDGQNDGLSFTHRAFSKGWLGESFLEIPHLSVTWCIY